MVLEGVSILLEILKIFLSFWRLSIVILLFLYSESITVEITGTHVVRSILFHYFNQQFKHKPYYENSLPTRFCTLEFCEVADIKWISISWGLSTVCPSHIELIRMDYIPKNILASCYDPFPKGKHWNCPIPDNSQQEASVTVEPCHKIPSQSHKGKEENLWQWQKRCSKVC